MSSFISSPCKASGSHWWFPSCLILHSCCISFHRSHTCAEAIQPDSFNVLPFSGTEVPFQLQRVTFIITKGNAASPNYLLPLWSPFVGLPSPASGVPDERLPYQPGCAFSFTFSILSSLSHSSSQVWSLLTLLRLPPPKHHLCFSIWVLLSALSLSPFFRCDRLIYFPGFC